MPRLDVTLMQKLANAAGNALPRYKYKVEPRVVEAVISAIARTNKELSNELTDIPMTTLREAYPAIALQITKALENNPEPPPFEERMKGLALGPYTSTQDRPPTPIKVQARIGPNGFTYLDLKKAGLYVPDGKRKLQGYLNFFDFIDGKKKMINIQEYDVVLKRFAVEEKGFLIEECNNGDGIKITAPANFTGTERLQTASVLSLKQPGVIPLDIFITKQN